LIKIGESSVSAFALLHELFAISESIVVKSNSVMHIGQQGNHLALKKLPIPKAKQKTIPT
jgi:hypothetical protein